MININEFKAFINKVEGKMREAEIEEAKAQQQLEYAIKNKEEAIEEIKEHGYTPENIVNGINEIEQDIINSTKEIEEILNKLENGDYSEETDDGEIEEIEFN